MGDDNQRLWIQDNKKNGGVDIEKAKDMKIPLSDIKTRDSTGLKQGIKNYISDESNQKKTDDKEIIDEMYTTDKEATGEALFESCCE